MAQNTIGELNPLATLAATLATLAALSFAANLLAANPVLLQLAVVNDTGRRRRAP